MGKILTLILCLLFTLGAPVWAASKEDLEGIKEQATLKEKQLKNGGRKKDRHKRLYK